MGHIRLILGRTRARRRRALPALGYTTAGRPAHLLVTDTQRKRDQVLRAYEGRPTFQPEVRVMGELFAALWARMGDGRALLTGQALRLAARRLLWERASEWPSLEALGPGPHLPEALAALEQRLAHHRLTQVGEPDTDAALQALRARIAGPGAYVRPSAAWENLLRLLEESPDLLPAAFVYPLVVIDEVLQPTPLEAALLMALARAWAARGAEVAITVASGRDRGGAEVGALLGWEEPLDDEAGQELRTFAAASSLRRAAFGLVETGEATVHLARAEDLLDIEPWSEPEPAAPPDLADHLAAGSPLPVHDRAEATGALGEGHIRLLRCADPTEEVWSAAQQLVQVLAEGTPPSECVVAVAGLPTLRPLLELTFRDCGIPYEIGGGTPLGWRPVVQAALAALHIGAHGPDLDRLCRLGHRLDPGRNLARIRHQLSSAGLGADPDRWAQELDGWLVRNRLPEEQRAAMHQALEALLAVARACEPLGTAVPAAAWLDHVVEHLEELGLARSCGADPEQLKTWGALVSTLERFATDLAAVDPGAWPVELLAEELGRACLRSGVSTEPRHIARVPVVDVRELVGLTPQHTWVLGLTRSAFPARSSVAFLVPHRLRGTLAPDRMAEGRYLLAAVLREALEAAASPDPARTASLTLSWPSTRDGRGSAPSPLLADLLHLPTAEPGVQLGDIAVQEPSPAAQGVAPRSRAAACRLLAADPRWAHALSGAITHEFRIQAEAVEARRAALGPRDGMLERGPDIPHQLSVTALEAYLRCPARFWYDRVLGLAPPDAWAPELEPRRRGTALHRILEAFLLRHGLAPLATLDPAEAAHTLAEVADTVLTEVEHEGGFDPAFQAYARERWLSGLVDDRPAGILRAWLDDELAADPPRAPQAVEAQFRGLKVGPVELKGALDRLDRLPSGALLVTDYKTGTPPSRRAVAEGLSLQAYAYAEAASRVDPEAPVVTAFQSLARPDTIRRSGFMGDPEALEEACSTVEQRMALPLGREGRREALERAGMRARELLSGRFPPTRLGPDLAGCAQCPHARVCRVDHHRHQGRGSDEEGAA